MVEEYADEWTFGTSTLALKDNTFLLDDGHTGRSSAGRYLETAAFQQQRDRLGADEPAQGAHD